MRPVALLLDLDGTVHRAGHPTSNAPETLRTALAHGIQLRYLTNNSTVTGASVTAKLKAMGIPCEPNWVYGTASVAAHTLAERGAKRAFVIGESALRDAVQAAGVKPVDEAAAVQGEADHVVQGLCRSFSYSMLRAAHRALQHGAHYLVTNRDATFPAENGLFDPGSGAITASIETVSGVTPTVVGKPGPALIHAACADLGCRAEEVLVVGDRLDTDIAAGLAAGAPTWLVLTGVAQSIPDGQAGSDDLGGLASLWV